MPVYLLRFHSPSLSAALAGATWRAAASISATASSAAETMLEVGALTTITPLWVAALTSTLSRPTPARATTLSRGAAASASASTLVALRTRIASTSAIAGSSSARSAPLQVPDLEVGPERLDGGGAQLFGDEYDGLAHCRCPQRLSVGSCGRRPRSLRLRDGGGRARRCAHREDYPTVTSLDRCVRRRGACPPSSVRRSRQARTPRRRPRPSRRSRTAAGGCPPRPVPGRR